MGRIFRNRRHTDNAFIVFPQTIGTMVCFMDAFWVFDS